MTTRQKWWVRLHQLAIGLLFAWAIFAHFFVHKFWIDAANSVSVMLLAWVTLSLSTSYKQAAEREHYAQFKSDTDAMYATHNHYDE